jgi:8-oxo-dGTP pyrophosphatase MutT (NUDIX family)
MPPGLRREVYEALGLRVTVSADGGMWAEARVDGAVVRFSREVERYARALCEADERIGAAPPEPQGERLGRIEWELARVRRELASPPVADTVMAVVAGE